MALGLGNISFAYPLNEHQHADFKSLLQPQGWRKHGKVESEKFSNKAEDISNTFRVIFETLPDTQRVSRQITVYNVTKGEKEAMAGSLWTKSHVIEVISERNVKIRTKGKIGSEIKEVQRPDPKFSDKIK